MVPWKFYYTIISIITKNVSGYGGVSMDNNRTALNSILNYMVFTYETRNSTFNFYSFLTMGVF